MKKNSVLKLSGLMVGGLVLTCVLAGSLETLARVPGRLGRGFGPTLALDSELVAALAQTRIRAVATKLGLSEAQREQIRSIMQKNKEALKSALMAVAEARRGMLEIGLNAEAPLSSGDFSAQAAILSQAQAEAAAGLANLRLEVRAVLTPEQTARLDEIRKAMKERLSEPRIADAILESMN